MTESDERSSAESAGSSSASAGAAPTSSDAGGGGDGGGPARFPARLVTRIAAFSGVTGLLCAFAAYMQYGLVSALSSLLGTAIGVVNLWALARLVVALLQDSEAGGGGAKARAAVLLGLKSIGLVTLVGVLVVNGWVRGGALMAGLSVVALSIVVASVWPDGGASPPS